MGKEQTLQRPPKGRYPEAREAETEEAEKPQQAKDAINREAPKKRSKERDRLYACDFAGCERRFYQRSDLKRHKRTHLGLRPFTCSVCAKTFTQRGSMYRHIVGVHKLPALKKKDLPS